MAHTHIHAYTDLYIFPLHFIWGPFCLCSKLLLRWLPFLWRPPCVPPKVNTSSTFHPPTHPLFHKNGLYYSRALQYLAIIINLSPREPTVLKIKQQIYVPCFIEMQNHLTSDWEDGRLMIEAGMQLLAELIRPP